MPAIQPARLRLQATRLAELFDQPAAFTRALHGLLELYADRTHRAGQAGEPSTLLSSYHVPAPMLRQLMNELRPLARQQAEAALALCDALWAEPYIEFRTLAASLLGQIPCDPSAPVLERLQHWLTSGVEQRLQEALFDAGLARLRQERPESLLTLAKEWIGTGSPDWQQQALRLLRPLADDNQQQIFPGLYTAISPLIRKAPRPLRPDVIELLAALGRAAPQETAYVLRQSLAAPGNPDAAWIIRQVLDVFPPDQQASLRAALRGQNPLE